MTAPTATDPTPGTVPLRARGWGIPILLAVVVLVALVAVGAGFNALLSNEPDPKTVTFVVPEGTAEKLYFGEAVDIMPAKVELNVGDTLVIRNDDSQVASVGPYTIRAGETLSQTFQRPQTLIGECTLSGTGEVTIVVTEA